MAELTSSTVAGRLSPTLSASQLARLTALGEERTAGVGQVLYEVGDQRYPFIAVREGEVRIRDAVGNEIMRHRASGFLGDLNLLSGQTVFVTAVVTEPLRYIAVERETLRSLLFEDSGLSDLVLPAFIARREMLQARKFNARFATPYRAQWGWLEGEFCAGSDDTDGILRNPLAPW